MKSAAIVVVISAVGCDIGPWGVVSGSPQQQAPLHWIQPLTGEIVDDLGVVEGGRQFDHELRIVNRGDSTLRLSSNLTTSCGCTKATLSKLVLAPGEESSVNLQIQASAQNMRRQAVNVIIQVLDPPNMPPAQVAVVFDSLVGWTVLPSELRFVGESAALQQATMRVVGSGLRDVRILGVSCDFPGAKVDFDDRTIQKESQAMVKLSFNLPETEGDSFFLVAIETDDPHVPRLEIPVYCQVKPTFQIAPKSLLVNCTSDKPTSREVTVKSEREFSLRLEGVPDMPGFVARLSATESNNDVKRIVFELDPAKIENGVHRHVVTLIATAHGVQNRIDVPILVVREFTK